MLYSSCSDLPHSFLSKSHSHDHITIVIPSPALNLEFLSSMSLRGNNARATREQISSAVLTVSQALEFARDSEEGARDPSIIATLETAIRDIWARIERAPETYVLTRDEFAVFNYFQGRFAGQPLAIAARKRYWDHLSLTNGAS